MLQRTRRRLAWLALPGLLISGAVALALAGATLPVDSVSEILPDDVVAFAHVRDVRAQWDALRRTEAYEDLRHSRLVQSAIAMGAFDDLERMLAERAKRLGLEPTLETYLDFVGREVALALRIDRETGEPSYIMAYRVDTPALMRKLAVQDPAALGRLLTERYFGEHAPDATPYGGFDVYALGAEAHYALVRDVFVASNSRKSVEAVIDHALAAGAGSLGQTERFKTEMARLPDGTSLAVYVDLERVLDNELLQAMSGQDMTPFLTEFHRQFRPTEAIAVGLRLPEGDLYRAEPVASRSARALLRDTASPEISALLPTDGALYFETADLRAMGKAVLESELLARLRKSPRWKELIALLDQPEEIERRFGVDLDLPPAPEGIETNTRFERRMLGHLLTVAGRLAAPGAVGVAIDAPQPDGFEIPAWLREALSGAKMQLAERGGDPDVPQFGVAVKLPPLAQVAAALIDATVAQQFSLDPGNGAVPHPVGDRTLLVVMNYHYDWNQQTNALEVSARPVAGVARIGDTLLASTDLPRVQRLLVGGDTETATSDAFAAVPDGWAWRMRMRSDLFQQFVQQAAQRGGAPDPALQAQAAFTAGLGATVQAGYVRDGLRTWEVRSWQTIDPEHASPYVRSWLDLPNAPFEAWKLLPSDTVLHFAWRMEPEPVFETVRSLVAQRETDKAQWEDALQQVSELLGVDVEEQLLPALGTDVTLSIAPQPRPADAHEQAVAAPALLLTWSLDDPQVLETALGNLLERAIAPPLPPDASDEERAQAPQHHTQPVGDATVHVIDPPAASGVAEQTAGTVRPAYAIVGKQIVIGSSAAAVRDAVARAQGKLEGSYAASPARERAAAAVGGDAQLSFAHLDLAGLARLLDSYAPLLAQAMPPTGAGPEFPEIPDNGDMEAFEKALEKYRREASAFRQEQARKNERIVHEICGTLEHWFDFAAAGAGRQGNAVTGRSVLRLK